MTKTQVKTQINKLFKDYMKRLESDLDKLLREADMWYGDRYSVFHSVKKDKCIPEDRKANLLVEDGYLDEDVNISHWLHTRKELMEFID